MQITLKNNELKGLIDSISRMPKNIKEKIVKPALRDAVKTGQTMAIRDITQTYNIPRVEVASTFHTKIDESITGIGYRGQIVSSTRNNRKNLINFAEKKVSLAQARRRAKNNTLKRIRVKVRKQSGWKTLNNNTFIAKGKNNNTLIFERMEGSYYRRPFAKNNTKHNQKLRALSTIVVPSMLNSKKLIEPLTKRIQDSFAKRIDWYAQKVLSKL